MTLVAPVVLHTLEMKQSAQVCIHRMITVVTIHKLTIILQSWIPRSTVCDRERLPGFHPEKKLGGGGGGGDICVAVSLTVFPLLPR